MSDDKTHLPVIGRSSTAATTAFVHATLEFDSETLVVDGNQKITAGNGSYEDPRPNAFSIVNVEDCPGSTPTCRASCYVQGIEKHVADLHALYRQNSAAIRRILQSSRAYNWAQHFAGWIGANAPGGFRWHVSGDVFSEEYAEWIAAVAMYSQRTRHWIYTRSFDFVGPLLEQSTTRGGNLAINLSADQDNYAQARELADKHGLRICYMVLADGVRPPDMREGDVLFPDYPLRGGKGQRPGEIRDASEWWQGLTADERRMVCPVDMYGKSEPNRCGPCDRCLR